MRTRAKVLIAVCMATAIFMLDVGAATATRIGITNAEKGFRIAWERFDTELRGEVGGGSVICHFTLRGTFQTATFAKVEGTRIGLVDRAIPGTCEGGRVTVLAETLPWPLEYSSFTGTLPNITEIAFRVIGAAIQVNPNGGSTCLVRTEAVHPLKLRAARDTREGTLTVVEAEFSNTALRCELFSYNASMIGSAGSPTVLAESAVPIFQLTEASIRAPVAPSFSGSGEFGRLEAEGVARRVFTVTAGTEAITVESIRVRAGNYFAITDPNRCIGRSIAINERCSFDAVFTAPAETGRSVEDELTVEAGLSAFRATLRGST